LTLLTGWLPWDPIFAIAVALNILWSGVGLIRKSISGLMDTADAEVHEQARAILDAETSSRNIRYHKLRHRNLGDFHWVELHLLFPKNTTVQEAHRIATEIETKIENSLDPGAYVTTHLEAIEDHEIVHSNARH
jgi:divalent metal cation (Fe/Co/Zn/Cd) transporter